MRAPDRRPAPATSAVAYPRLEQQQSTLLAEQENASRRSSPAGNGLVHGPQSASEVVEEESDMSVYSTVVAELECERCHSTYPTDVQFQTSDDRDMPEYVAGQLVPALKPGTTYEGIADAFCSCSNSCFRRS